VRWRGPETALFVLALGVYAYFFQGGSWNSASRFDLVRAVVEQHTLRIDDYHQNTGDLALRDGHYYCDKAPGLSFVAVPAYALVHPFAGDRRPRARLVNRGAWLATVWAVGVPSAAAVVMVFHLAGPAFLGLPAATAAALALSYAFGTLALPYSTLFYGHQLAAALLIVAFGLLVPVRRGEKAPTTARLALTGILLGTAVAVEYPAALAVAAILGFEARRARLGRRWVPLLAGLAIPLLLLAAYHTVAFGHPLALPYHFSTDAPRHRGLALGIGLPEPRVMAALLVSRYRGLLYSAPWLLLAAPGAVVLLRDRARRPEGLVCAIVPLVLLALNASLGDWHGGWGTGPRHLVPALPFLALAAGGVFATRWARLAGIAAAPLVAVSIMLMLMATAVQPEVPRWYGRPFEQFVVPRFLAGNLAVNTLPLHTGTVHERREATNLGERLGLRGWGSLAPLAAFVTCALVWLVRTLRVARRNESRSVI
jgi:hypothetical protein